MSKLLRIALPQCFDPPHDFKPKTHKTFAHGAYESVDLPPIVIDVLDIGWVRCTKCGLVTSEEVLAAMPEAFE